MSEGMQILLYTDSDTIACVFLINRDCWDLQILLGI